MIQRCIDIFKRKPLHCILLFVLLIGVTGTIAYYRSEVLIPNEFQTMTYNVSCEEVFNNQFGTKEVSFVNHEDSVPVVLRIQYDEQWILHSGSYEYSGEIILPNADSTGNYVDKNWTTDFLNDFVLGSDGWYYYKKVLNANSSVKVLNSISKSSSMPTAVPTPTVPVEYSSLNDYNLSFNYEAIQASNDAILEIWNKNCTISGSDITWDL